MAFGSPMSDSLTCSQCWRGSLSILPTRHAHRTGGWEVGHSAVPSEQEVAVCKLESICAANSILSSASRQRD